MDQIKYGKDMLGSGISSLAGVSGLNHKLERSSYQDDYSRMLKFKKLLE